MSVRFLSRAPQVAVMLPPSIKVCRDMKRGVLRYARTHGPWTLHLIEDRSLMQRLSAERSIYSGIIGQPTNEDAVRMVARMKVPMVLVDPQFSKLSRLHRQIVAHASLIRCDTEEVGRLAARHFLSAGYRNFAYVGAGPYDVWSKRRYSAFAEVIKACGFTASNFVPTTDVTLSDQSEELCRWLVSLPKPCAILCAWDLRARQTIDACVLAGIAVPDEVTVLGVDDDEDLCFSVNPPIPSIRMDAERAGYEAARVLDDMMRGGTGEDYIDYGPVEIVNRGAPRPIAGWNDPFARGIIEFVMLNAANRVTVRDVACHANVSVRVLERRFAAIVGKTVRAYIEEVRLERVKTMLRETNESIKSIALTCGYATVSHLTARFREHEQMTMSDYRARLRG